MAIRDIFKVSRKTFVNPSAWVGLDSIKAQNRTIWAVLSSLFSTPKPKRRESFEEAMKRQELEEADIANQYRHFRRYALLFSLLGLAIFLYSFFLLFHYGTFLGWFLGLAVSGLFFSQAFRFDFWALQLKKRKLGLSFADWKRHILGAEEDLS